MEVSDEGFIQVPLVNPTGFNVTIQAKGHATEASLVSDQDVSYPEVKVLTARTTSREVSMQDKQRQEKLMGP